MNVASVTVIAITQGLMFPSGVRNLAKILFRIAAILVLAPTRYYAPAFHFIPPALPLIVSLRDDRRVHIHPWPQNRFLRRNRIEHDFHGNALHYLDVIAGGIFRR